MAFSTLHCYVLVSVLPKICRSGSQRNSILIIYFQLFVLYQMYRKRWNSLINDNLASRRYLFLTESICLIIIYYLFAVLFKHSCEKIWITQRSSAFLKIFAISSMNNVAFFSEWSIIDFKCTFYKFYSILNNLLCS